MSFWSGETLLDRLKTEELVTPFSEERIDCAAYTLTLGGSAFTSGDNDQRTKAFEQGKTPGDIKISQGEKITIQPGQFAFLLTEEKVTIPHDAVGFISIKATHKYAGLINVSGFHVDPGWSSPLIFAVFNAGPRELTFERGQPLFLLFFASLDRLSSNVKKEKKYFNNIPADFMQKMAGEVPSLFKLSKTSKDLESKIQEATWKANIANGLAILALTFTLSSGGILFSKLIFPQTASTPVTQSSYSPQIQSSIPTNAPQTPPSKPANNIPTSINNTTKPGTETSKSATPSAN